jgi:hypothetical protein
VSTGLSGEDRFIGNGEGHVDKRGEDRLPKENMRSAGIGEDGRRGNRT